MTSKHLLWSIDAGFTYLSALYCMALGIVLRRLDQWLIVELIVTVGVALPLNAFVAGALSAPVGRYGARIAWLLPFIAVASWRTASARSASTA